MQNAIKCYSIKSQYIFLNETTSYITWKYNYGIMYWNLCIAEIGKINNGR